LQEEYLYLIAVRFRRQMPPRLVEIARRNAKLIEPLVMEERARRKREAEDRKAKRAAVKRANQRGLTGQTTIEDIVWGIKP
jgi:hypothetical protein